jgi:hypothetical protein
MENIAKRHLAKRGLAMLAAVVAKQFSVSREGLRMATQLLGQRLAAYRADQTAFKVPRGNEREDAPALCVAVKHKHSRFFTDRKQFRVEPMSSNRGAAPHIVRAHMHNPHD